MPASIREFVRVEAMKYSQSNAGFTVRYLRCTLSGNVPRALPPRRRACFESDNGSVARPPAHVQRAIARGARRGARRIGRNYTRDRLEELRLELILPFTGAVTQPAELGQRTKIVQQWIRCETRIAKEAAVDSATQYA